MSEYKFIALLGGLLLLAIAIVLIPVRQHKHIMHLGIIFSLIGLSLFGYWYWGSFPALLAHKQQQAKKVQVEALLQSMKSPQQLVDRLKKHLEQHPESARGWFLLGRLYAGQGAWFTAFEVFKRAHQLEPNNEEITVNYAQSMWQNNNQKLNASIRKLFENLLRNNPNQPDALSMLAIDSFQQHAYQQAIRYWTKLLDLLPQDSDDANAIRRAIAKAHEMDTASYKKIGS